MTEYTEEYKASRWYSEGMVPVAYVRVVLLDKSREATPYVTEVPVYDRRKTAAAAEQATKWLVESMVAEALSK